MQLLPDRMDQKVEEEKRALGGGGVFQYLKHLKTGGERGGGGERGERDIKVVVAFSLLARILGECSTI